MLSFIFVIIFIKKTNVTYMSLQNELGDLWKILSIVTIFYKDVTHYTHINLRA